MRIVFLGRDNSVLSIACLEALVADGSHSVVVGVAAPRQPMSLKSIGNVYRAKGLRFVMARGLHRCLAKLRIVARKLGA